MNELGPIFNTLTDVRQCPPGAVEEYYLNHFSVGRGGFFVECGAGNGLIQTNTVVLERELEWSGLLIESHDLLFAELRRNRSNPRVQCVHETAGAPGAEVMFDEIIHDGTPGSQYLGWSGVVSREGRFTKRKKSKSFTDILKENGAPDRIDFCVIDVENTSADVLAYFDLEAFHVQLLAVEIKPIGRYADTVNRILAYGYALRHIIPAGPDYIFVKT